MIEELTDKDIELIDKLLSFINKTKEVENYFYITDIKVKNNKILFPVILQDKDGEKLEIGKNLQSKKINKPKKEQIKYFKGVYWSLSQLKNQKK